MNQNELKWVYPETLHDALNYVKNGFRICGGGLSFIKKNISDIKGFVLLHKLNFNKIEIKENHIFIGACATVSDLLNLNSKNPDTVTIEYLKKSLQSAASTPIRNRMTFGGSLKEFPLWSDLNGPLSILEAELIYYDGDIKSIPVYEYFKNKLYLENHIITCIKFNLSKKSYFFNYRLSRVNFDYNSLTLNLCGNLDEDNQLRDFNFIITGVKSKILKPLDLIEEINNEKINLSLVQKIISKHVDFDFISDYKYSKSYKNKITSIFIKDCFVEMLGGENATEI
ncbi:MAG: FAD binding domain-containing protein [Candidatus Muiribacteriota bacterium]